MKTYLIPIAFLLLWAGCNRDDLLPTRNGAGEITSLPYLWRFDLHKDGNVYGNSIIKENLIFDGKVLIGTTEGPGDNWLSAVDLETGKEIWKWNDIYQPPTEMMDIRFAYRNEYLMTYVVGSRHYCINLDNGQTHWRIRRDDSYDNELWGLDNTYYIMGPPTDTLQEYRVQVGHEGNLMTGELKQILIPELSQEYVAPGNILGGVVNMVPFLHEGDTMFVVTYAEPLPNWYVNSFLGLYNKTQKKWLYDRIQITEPTQNSSVFHPPVIHAGRVYLQAGYGILCHDLWTGEQHWAKEDFSRDFLFSGFILAEGKVLANCEDKYLYCLDAETGAILWQEATAGTSSRPRYLNGIVYLSGGSTDRIHAIDVATGKTVWRLDPRGVGDGSTEWRPDLFVAPGQNGKKGKVIVRTPRYAYCFEAYR